MSWNQPGMEPGGELPDYEEPWPQPAYPLPDYGQSPQAYPPPHGQPPGYGQPPGQGQPRTPYPGGNPADYADPAAYAPDTDAWQPGYGAPDDDQEDVPPEGRRVTPFRVVALIAMVLSGGVAAVSLLVLRGSQSIAITVAALGIFGMTAALIGIAFAASAVQAARYGRLLRSVLGGLVGGLFVLMASGAVASAVIFVLLSRA